MKKKTLVPAGFGLINLQSKVGSLYKKSLLCRTGKFNGLYGEVVVSKELLERIAQKYNSDRSSPQNENDYSPILLDHERKADNVKGRIMADLVVEEWKELDGNLEFGLFGTLRIDDRDAIKNVEDGKYAHLSISFDEESAVLSEVSFVAVEAATGSIILSEGGNMNLEKKLASLSKKHKSLAQAVQDARKTRKVSLGKLLSQKNEVTKEIDLLMKKANTISLSVKSAQLKGKFAEFIKLGKMNPAEMKEIDFNELATLSESSLKIVLSSYDKRQVSSDVFQFGQSSKGSMKPIESKEEMKKAIELQRSGKGTIKLSAEEGKEKKEDESLSEEEKETLKSYSMGEEDYKKCLEEISGIHTKLSEIVEKIKAMGGVADELGAAEETQEEKEKELSKEESEEKEGDQ